MMAHELPTPIHQAIDTVPNHNANTPVSSSQRLKKDKNNKKKEKTQEKVLPLNDDERRLPSGAKVDFGGSSNSNGGNASNGNKKSRKGGSTKQKENRKLTASPSLPNGEKPNFFNEKPSKELKKKKSMQNEFVNEPSLSSGAKPSLPSGAKPKFGKLSKKQSHHEQSLPSGEKPNFYNEKAKGGSSTLKEKKEIKDKKVEDTYAGSSFHSSPAALQLPKPSFRATSLKQQQSATSDEEGTSSLSSASSVVSSDSPTNPPAIPAVADQPRQPQAEPLKYPVTAYPPGSIPPPQQQYYQTPHYPYPQFIQTGFAYQMSPQGYIQYPYPQQTLQHPIYSHYHAQPILAGAQLQPPQKLQQQPQSQSQAPQQQQPQQGGHKITFNELLSSSKN